MDLLLKRKLAAFMTARTPEAEQDRHARIAKAILNPEGVPGVSSTRTASGTMRKDLKFNVPKMLPSAEKVDPLVEFYLHNTDVLKARLEMFAKKSRMTIEEALNVFNGRAPYTATILANNADSEAVRFMQKIALLSMISDRIANIGKPADMELRDAVYRKAPIVFDGAKLASSTGSNVYDLDWFRAHSMKLLANITAVLHPLGYKYRTRRIDNETSLFIFSPPKKQAVVKDLPTISLVGMRTKDLFFDLFIGKERYAAFVYDVSKNAERLSMEGVPPSLLSPDFNGCLSISDASFYRQSITSALGAIKTVVSEVVSKERQRRPVVPHLPISTDYIRRKGNSKYRKMRVVDLSGVVEESAVDKFMGGLPSDLQSSLSSAVKHFKMALIGHVLFGASVLDIYEDYLTDDVFLIARLLAPVEVDEMVLRSLLTVSMSEEACNSVETPTPNAPRLSMERALSADVNAAIQKYLGEVINMIHCKTVSRDRLDAVGSELLDSVREPEVQSTGEMTVATIFPEA